MKNEEKLNKSLISAQMDMTEGVFHLFKAEYQSSKKINLELFWGLIQCFRLLFDLVDKDEDELPVKIYDALKTLAQAEKENQNLKNQEWFKKYLN